MNIYKASNLKQLDSRTLSRKSHAFIAACNAMNDISYSYHNSSAHIEAKREIKINPPRVNQHQYKSVTELLEIDPKSGVALKNDNEVEETNKLDAVDVPVEVEAKTGVSFPVKLGDGKQLNAVGLRKKSMLGLGIKIYGFGLYADNKKMGELLRTKTGKAPSKPTKETYQMVIDSDVEMMVRLVIVFSGITMSMVRKNFDQGLGSAIKKLTGGKNEELTKMIMGQASDDIKLTPGSLIEISRRPGYVLQTKVMDEIVSTVESELLCRAFIYMYLGEDPFDKEAKEKFGASLLSLF